jgi:hypothetical protein
LTLTQILALPTAVLQAGKTYGPFVTPQVGSSYSKYQLNFQILSWPTTGNVLQVQVDRSQDGGNTWAFDAGITYGPGLSGTHTWLIEMGRLNPGPNAIVLTTAPVDLFRVTLTALQSCSALITVGGVP